MFVDEIETPLGLMYLAAREDAVCALSFEPLIAPRRALAASDAVRRYFAGEFDAFDRLALDPAGTPFQKAVWQRVRVIPHGATRSYGALAAELRSAPRAVGAANAANPLALIVPCHRVIAADGSLRGYAWGLERKSWLLQHERQRFGAMLPCAPAVF